MDHRQLVNAVAFVVGFLCMVALGVATAASPSTWYRMGPPGFSPASGWVASFIAGCDLNLSGWAPTRSEAAAMAACVVDPLVSGSATASGASGYYVVGTQWRLDYASCVLSDDRACGGEWYLTGNFVTAQKCWDGLDPVAGVCPDPPTCTVGETMRFSVPGDSLIPLCRSGCRWENSGVGVCVAGSCFSEYTSTGDVCTVGPPGMPLSNGTEWVDSPVTETTTNNPAPVTNGDTVTEQQTVTTQTDESVRRDTVNNQTTITETSVHGVTKTTTTTTTTHGDGSQTITETVSYQRTDPTITTTRIGSGGSVTTQPGETVTGSRTTTTVVGADGSVTSTTTESGVGGDGEGGPESDDGECGILPQVVCDFLSGDGEGEEHPGLPAEEVGGEMVAYDSGLGGGSCPGSVGTSFMGQSISYDYSDACYVATTYFRPILLAIAAIAAAFIIVGARL